jgi:UrcA family protein
MRKVMSSLLMSAFVLGSSLLTITANAGDARVVVQYSDLDLSKPQAVEALYGRIEKAAQRLCTDSGWRRVDERVKEQQCIARTIADTVAKIPNERLAALYKQRSSNAG